ncbi:4Fe-4S binding domain-containing protein [Desulfuromusa kysingii]|uniref:4Fe-4S binding domain-containing protein n=1 Tax=Desulfuromusa kysingii TaxID=37625 RepID=A0A1H4BEE8_9BACT|nr:4Fe-4S binding protein [Desulfuromusa kysingii]SEA46531.1 4Fe-4S binding domain-containing protein [Desulfuromusa kysingii]
MAINTAHLIYFSPTGTTRRTLEAIVTGIAPTQIHHHNLTHNSANSPLQISSGIAIIGVPVYAGRVPADCLHRIANFKSDNVPTIIVALYGNREFEDALVELRDVATTQGFSVIAAGAFIGEHSYSTPENPIAAGRPNADDLKLALTFGQQVAKKLKNRDFNTPEIEGNVPYKERVKFGGLAPETNEENCTLCGKCAEVCPVEVITVSDSVKTDAAHCIMCCSCIKNCGFNARAFNHPVIQERTELLVNNCAVPKTPKIFI